MTERVKFDDLVEDIFGLNVRGVRSIATLWRTPRTYFDAAAAPDWRDRYTPSIRLWLSLIALTSLLQFIWIGSGTPLVEAYAQGFRDANISLVEHETYEELAQQTALWIFAIFPVVQLVMFLLILPLFPLWGRGVGFSQRARNGFAMMIPSSSIMIVVMPSMTLVPTAHVTAYGMLIGLVALIIDASTVFRGAFPGRRIVSRAARSLILAGVVLTLNVTAHIATQIATIVVINIRYGLVPAS